MARQDSQTWSFVTFRPRHTPEHLHRKANLPLLRLRLGSPQKRSRPLRLLPLQVPRKCRHIQPANPCLALPPCPRFHPLVQMATRVILPLMSSSPAYYPWFRRFKMSAASAGSAKLGCARISPSTALQNYSVRAGGKTSKLACGFHLDNYVSSALPSMTLHSTTLDHPQVHRDLLNSAHIPMY